MKSLILIMAILGVMTIAQAAHSEESMSSKIKETANDTKRASKKGLHRVQEATCTENEVGCAAKKAGNRIQEGTDYTKDKINEATDKK